MKKRVFLLLMLLLFPSFVSAKEYCRVVSGDGKSLGSEIACGSEHFYILSSNENEIRMLAKYNLHTGVTIYKEKIEKEEGDPRSDEYYCIDLASKRGGTVKSDGFYYDPGYCFYKIINTKEKDYYSLIEMESGDTRTNEEYCQDLATQNGGEFVELVYEGVYYCRYKKTFPDYNLQSKDAKSAHWDADLNYLYPQVADVYAYPSDANNIHQEPIKEDTSFYDFDINFDFSSDSIIDDVMTYGNEAGMARPLYVYRYLLQQMGYEINDISLLSVSEMDAIAKKLTNQSLPLKEWQNNLVYPQDGIEIHFGDLKPFFKEQSWLYSTTYWNSTVFRHESTYEGKYYVFTAEQGKLCGAGIQVCASNTTLGCGIRPLVTISNENLVYLIKTVTDGNGSVEVVENSLGGKTIQFKINAKKGYRLSKLVVTSDSGEKVEFSRGDIINNSDGTVSIDKNKFVMPFENVTIEARWEAIIINPETGKKLGIIILFILSIIGLSYYRTSKTEVK